ncbi:GH25 family lysozyme [Gallintestinimicrobium sp.]|uniref:GH25 family lysozyme n=1 Tax=Gallintestinimicrobium sp. TaxID=2981655 RepID=UPI003990E16B
MEEQHKKKKTGSAKKAAPHGIKDRKSVSEQKKKAQRAERIPERKKSNWDDGEFLDDWDEVSGKTPAHSNKRRVKKPAGKSSQNRTVKHSASASTAASGRNRKHRSARKEPMAALDIAIALTGVLVLAAAAFTTSMYLGRNEQNKQMEAVAAVGKNLEAIGMSGEDVLSAVAVAAQNVSEEASEEETTETETGYEEKDLEANVDVILKLSSMQKDMKIKFADKNSGKLIGNQPFTVKLEGASSQNAKDDDKDGIIYLKDLKAGDYVVTVTGPDEISGRKAAGISGRVTVKDKIEYKKVDVTDEIKKESEINVAKEDTAIAPAVESVLQDTVEWVASTKTPAGNGQEYEEVGKSDIPEPAQARLLEPEIKYAYFAKETQIAVFDQPREESPAESENTPPSESESSSESESTKPSESESTKPTESESESGSSKPTESESTKPSESESTKPSESESATESSTAATEPTKTPETKPEEIKVKKITISGSATVEVGQTVSLSVTVSPDNAANKSVRWEIVSGKEFVSVDDKGTVKGVKAGEAKIKAVAQDGSNVESGISTVKVTEKKINRGDTKTLLKDKNGNQLYCKDGDTYREATTADYYTKDKFYRKKANVEYRYTGWQTIDGKRFFYDKNGTAVTGEQVIQGVKYTFNGDGSLNTGTVMGIDISKHNGNIDWNAVKNSGVQYVILRCGYRGSASGVLVEDQKFKSNIQGATAAGLKVGIYFFSQAVNEVEAVEEASMTLSLIKKYRITYPVYIDVESANGRADGISKAARTSVINAFCQTIRNSGYTPGLYANKNWLTEKINTGALGGCKIWLAQYVAAPTYGGRYEMWQYSSRGSIAGIKGNVDLNVSYMGY